jgi:hypothetical protein
MRRFAFGATALLAVVGCAGPPKMNPAAPIALDGGLLFRRYMQNGEAIDREDMKARLAENPASAESLESARTKEVVGIVLGAAGGALIGWPVGSAAVGDPNPPWVLAGVGAGLVAVAIPFGLMAESSLSDAAESHNASLAPAGAAQRAGAAERGASKNP